MQLVKGVFFAFGCSHGSFLLPANNVFYLVIWLLAVERFFSHRHGAATKTM